MKKKKSGPKGNIKFDDARLGLIMNIQTDENSEWKSVYYEDAKPIWRKTEATAGKVSRAKLEDLVGSKMNSNVDEDMVSDSDDSDKNMAIDLSDYEENKSDNLSSRLLRFINAKSLGPRNESLVD